MIDQPPESLVRGCNDPVSIGVLSDWIEEQYGIALDLDRSGWTDYGWRNIDGDGDGHGDFSFGSDGDGYGDGDGNFGGDGYGNGYISVYGCRFSENGYGYGYDAGNGIDSCYGYGYEY